MTPRAFDLAAYKARWRAACAAWDVDPIEGATGYQVVHVKVAQLQAERAKADRGRPVHVTASELRTLITHAPVFDEAPVTPQRANVIIEAYREVYREVHAEIRAERLRAVRGQFVAALVPALVELLEAEARAERLARMKRRETPLKLRHRARGFELRWLPDGFGGLRVVEAVVEMAGD